MIYFILFIKSLTLLKTHWKHLQIRFVEDRTVSTAAHTQASSTSEAVTYSLTNKTTESSATANMTSDILTHETTQSSTIANTVSDSLSPETSTSLTSVNTVSDGMTTRANESFTTVFEQGTMIYFFRIS